MAFTRRARSIVGGALLTSFVASIATISAVAAVAPNDLVISGTSTSTITMTLAAQTANFGSTMNPDGDASTGADPSVTATGNVIAAGACYQWGSSVSVSSNVIYQIDVDPTAANAKLHFLTADPASYAACTGGEVITVAPFTPVAFDTQAATPDREHAYWLGVNVLWADGPILNIALATLTFATIANV